MVFYYEEGDTMDEYFKKMYEIGTRGDVTTSISPFISTGQVTCVVLSDDNKIYKGIDIIIDNRVSMKAEACATASMLSNGSKYVKKVLFLNELGEVIMPSSDSIIYLMDFIGDDMKVLLPEDEIVSINDIIPDFYGTFRINE